MTIHPMEIYFYLPCSGLTVPPETEGLYLLYNSEKFFSHYFLIYFHSPILSFLKVLMEGLPWWRSG